MNLNRISFYNKENEKKDYLKKYEQRITKKIRKEINSNNYNEYINRIEYILLTKYYHKDYISNKLLDKIINSSIINVYKENNKKREGPLNNSISIDYLMNLSSNQYNPEYILYDEWEYHNLKTKVLKCLTWQEELVLNLKEQNYTIKEISHITDFNIRKVYYLSNRIRQKISKVLSNE